MRILIIEDDKQIAEFMRAGLEQLGHKLDIAHDGKDGLNLATKNTYDLLLIDRMLPSLDGLSIIRILRANSDNTPVLIVSALDNVDERVRGLRSGSDDYLVKPFSFSELEARVEALVRRARMTPHGIEPILRVGDLEMNIVTQVVTVNDKRMPLQNREFHLLRCLIEHRGQVVTRSMLLERVWDYHFDPQTNVIDVHVSRVRRKLEQRTTSPVIRTVRGSGYLIEE